MAYTQPNHFNPPPSPSHSFYPPPPPSFGPPHPPPSHPIVPPPHGFPPPAPVPVPVPVPPSPSPNNHPIVIVVVFVSLGGLVLLSLLAFALCCSIKKSKKKKKSPETEIIRVDEHKQIKETIVTDPFGKQAVVLSVEDDFHIEEEKTKNDKKFGQNLHATEDQGNSSSTDVGTTSSNHQHQEKL